MVIPRKSKGVKPNMTQYYNNEGDLTPIRCYLGEDAENLLKLYANNEVEDLIDLIICGANDGEEAIPEEAYETQYGQTMYLRGKYVLVVSFVSNFVGLYHFNEVK